MSSDAARVAELHMEGSVNCSQAVLAVYGKYFGLPEATAIKVATAFGAGMGRMGGVCGAVTGAYMVLGLTYESGTPAARGEVYDLVREFNKRFIARNGALSCRDLLGHDIGSPEGLDAIRQQKLTATVCPRLDRDAGEILEELLAARLPKPKR